MRGLLLVGTDTGVGKTTLACGLLQLAHRRGLRVVPYKPVETGCDPLPADAQRLLGAATLCDCHHATSESASSRAPALPHGPRLGQLDLSDVCTYAFAPPVAPSVAARLADNPISPVVLRQHADHLARRGDAILVEAAGGLLTPYAADLTSASLATLLDLDVLLVSANRLGTINLTALAIGELRRRQVPFQGVVLVDVAPTSHPDQPHNAAEIAALTGVSPLGVLRHVPNGDPALLADNLAADVDLRTIFEGRLLASAASPAP